MKRPWSNFALAALACLAALATTPLTAAPASAGNIILRAAGSEDPASNAAVRTVNTGTNHRYITTDFPTGATETCTLFHFGLFTDYTSLADITGSIWFTQSGSSTNTIQWRFDLQCVAPASENYDTVGLVNGTALNATTPNASGILNLANLVTNTLDETTAACTSGTPVILRVCRTANDGGTANPNTAKLVQIRLTY